MRLFIAEKPELARAIAKNLDGAQTRGNGCITVGQDVVTWCLGHLLELADPEDYNPQLGRWDMADLPLDFRPWKLRPIEKTKDQLNIVLELLNKTMHVVHAGDPDNEGQLLVQEVIEYGGFKGQVSRLLINDNTDRLVKKALDNMKDNAEFHALYESALGRSVADQHYGFNLTRLYTLSAQRQGHEGVLSVGRVQTPILGLVVRRDLAHEAHKQSFYYLVSATFEFAGLPGAQQNCRLLFPESAPVDEKGRLINGEWGKQCAEKVKGQSGHVVSCDRSEKKTAAPLPFNLLALQVEANKRFNMTSADVLKTTQSLRERHQLITYNRSDSRYLSDEQHEDAPAVLAAIASVLNEDRLLEGADSQIKSRAFNSANVTAHHAIIPTDAVVDWSVLTTEEQKIYRLLAEQYVVQFFPPYQYESFELLVESAGERWQSTSNFPLEQGWKKVIAKADDDTDGQSQTGLSAAALRQLTAKAVANCVSSKVDEKATKPPARYTEGTLLKDLTRVAQYIKNDRLREALIARDADKKDEHGGIGTPATRSAILETLQQRGFVVLQGKHLVSTPLGREFIALLPDIVTVPDITALWHEKQRRVETKEMTLDAFLDDVMHDINHEVARVKQQGIGKFRSSAAIECQSCDDGFLRRRKGTSGFFWGCSNYPDCRVVHEDKRGKPDFTVKEKPALSEHKCNKCQKPLIRRKGKKRGSYWWGCSGFPECKARFFDKKGAPDYASA